MGFSSCLLWQVLISASYYQICKQNELTARLSGPSPDPAACHIPAGPCVLFFIHFFLMISLYISFFLGTGSAGICPGLQGSALFTVSSLLFVDLSSAAPGPSGNL